jgi:hypothetical protein
VRPVVTFVDCICWRTIKTAQLFRQLRIPVIVVCPRAVREPASNNRCGPLRRYLLPFYKNTNDRQVVKWQKRERTVLLSAPNARKCIVLYQPFLIVGYTDPLIDFRGSVNLDWGGG